MNRVNAAARTILAGGRFWCVSSCRSVLRQSGTMKRLGVKAALLGGAIYYTVDAGVWRDAETTAVLYEDIQKKVEPYIGEVKKQIPYELPPLPGSDQISYLGKYYWNSGVKATFRFLADLPTHATEAASKTYNLISNSLSPEDNAAPSNTDVKK